MDHKIIFELTTCPGWNYQIRGAPHSREHKRINFANIYKFVDRWVVANLADKYTPENQADYTWELYLQATSCVYEEVQSYIDRVGAQIEIDPIYEDCRDFLGKDCLAFINKQLKDVICDDFKSLALINELFYKIDLEKVGPTALAKCKEINDHFDYNLKQLLGSGNFEYVQLV